MSDVGRSLFIKKDKYVSYEKLKMSSKTVEPPSLDQTNVDAIREYCLITGVSEIAVINEALETFVECCIDARLDSYYKKHPPVLSLASSR